MVIYPAIDIKNGKCVMLRQGRPNDKTIYSNDPLEVGIKWEKEGAEYIHIVDLDSAIYGQDRGNLAIVEEMRRNLTIPIQVGGGIRDIDKISYLLDDIGIDRVILGTLAIKDSKTLYKVARRYPSRIVVSIDAKDELVAIEGWTEKSCIKAVDLCSKIADTGIDTIIYTDISKDGMLEGPNIEFSREIIDKTGLDVIVSGGVTTIDDIRSIAKIGAEGAIIGRALYDGKIEFKKAIQAVKEVL